MSVINVPSLSSFIVFLLSLRIPFQFPYLCLIVSLVHITCIFCLYHQVLCLLLTLMCHALSLFPIVLHIKLLIHYLSLLILFIFHLSHHTLNLTVDLPQLKSPSLPNSFIHSSIIVSNNHDMTIMFKYSIFKAKACVTSFVLS